MSVLWCAGDITISTGNGSSSADFVCSTGFSIRDEFNPEFNPSDLDPSLIAGAIGAGLFSLVPVWAALLGLKFLCKPLFIK